MELIGRRLRILESQALRTEEFVVYSENLHSAYSSSLHRHHSSFESNRRRQVEEDCQCHRHGSASTLFEIRNYLALKSSE
jgi:hypothetical protein